VGENRIRRIHPRNFAFYLHDVAMAFAAFVVAYLLRPNVSATWTDIFEMAGAFALVAAIVYTYTGLYRHVWEYASLKDAVNIVKTATVVVLVFLPSLFFITRLEALPRSMLISVLFVLILLLAGFYLSWTAGRIDALHHRIEVARAALDAQLVRRSAVSMELGTCGLLDPAAAVLIAGAAHGARSADDEARELAESDLSRALRAALDQPGQLAELQADAGGAELVGELDAAAHRVVMARRFHNDAVRATRAVRRHRVVRWLHLEGRARPPQFFEMDDEPAARLSVK